MAPVCLANTTTCNVLTIIAQEQYPDYDDPKHVHQYRLESATDVFAVGRTMHSLMDLLGYDKVANEALGFDTPEGHEPQIDETSKNFYSEALIQLVKRCYERFPEDRIAADELCLEIQREVTANGRDAIQYQGLGRRAVLRLKDDNRYLHLTRR